MRQEKTLTFRDAIKIDKTAAFSTMVKPVGSTCNLRCAYCYYLEKESIHSRGVMSLELLERYIKDYIESNQADLITFCWHGGEPLLAGLPFYRHAIRLQQKYAGNKQVSNTLQTNGTLINDEWAGFMAENNFLVGLSLDGPEEVHNATRGASWAAVMRGLDCLVRGSVDFNTLSAVSHASEGRGSEIYNFLRSIGSQYMQFLPVQEFLTSDNKIATSGVMAPFSITAIEWGRFMIDIFDRWVVRDVGERFVQLFDATLANTCGMRAGICSLNESCGDAMVVEYTGDTYSCDHFVYPEHHLGNILSESLGSMYRSSDQFRFGANKHTTLHTDCRQCQYLHLCHGECPKHRDVDGLSTLCEGYKLFFRHTKPYFEQMRLAVESAQPASIVMPWARARMGLL